MVWYDVLVRVRMDCLLSKAVCLYSSFISALQSDVCRVMNSGKHVQSSLSFRACSLSLVKGNVQKSNHTACVRTKPSRRCALKDSHLFVDEARFIVCLLSV